jgi:hypothetical protein
MKPRVRFSTFRVDIGARRYLVDCKVIPPRAPAHAGADDVRFLDPGSPGRVELVRVRRGGLDVTDALDDDLRQVLRERCAFAAGIARVFIPQKTYQKILEFTR